MPELGAGQRAVVTVGRDRKALAAATATLLLMLLGSGLRQRLR